MVSLFVNEENISPQGASFSERYDKAFRTFPNVSDFVQRRTSKYF